MCTFKKLRLTLIALAYITLLMASSSSSVLAQGQTQGNPDLNRNDSNKLKNPGDMRKNYTYADPNNAPFVPREVHPMGRDIVEDQKSQGPGQVSHGGQEHDPIYKWPVVILEANSPVPTKRDMGIMDHRLRTFGYPMSDTQYQMIHRYNQNILLAEMFDPERVNWLLATTGNMQAQDAANTANNIERNQVASAIDFSASYLYNFTVDAGNRWNKIRDQLFIPMAFLLLLPGAVLAQVKVIVQAGSPVMGDSTSPFEGILRSIIAVFLIPATYLVINYGIDVANSITYTIAHEYERIFGTNMYRDALCAEIRAFPIRQAQENDNGIFKPSVPWNRLDPKGNKNETPAAKAESITNANMIEDPCANKRIVPGERTDEAANVISTTQRLMSGGSNAALAATWNILCAFQMAYLYYLWCVGPVIAALWVYPMKQLRDAFPSWIEGVITICFWSLFWNTVILLLACFRGVDETGTVIVSALNFLANACVKYAFDFAGLVKAAGQQAAGQALGAAANAAKGAGSGTHGQGQKGASPSQTQGGQGGNVAGSEGVAALNSPASSGYGSSAGGQGAGSSAGSSQIAASGQSGSFDQSARIPANGAVNDMPSNSLANAGASLLGATAGSLGSVMSGNMLANSSPASGVNFSNIGSPPPIAPIDDQLKPASFANLSNVDNNLLPPSVLANTDLNTQSGSALAMSMNMGLGASRELGAFAGTGPFNSANMDFGKGLPIIDGPKSNFTNLTSNPIPAIPSPSNIEGLKVDANYLSSWNQNWSPNMASNMIATSNSFNSWLSDTSFDQSFKDKFKDQVANLNEQLGPIANTQDPNSLFKVPSMANDTAQNVQLMAQQAASATQQQQYGQWQQIGQAWSNTLNPTNTAAISQSQLSQFQQFQGSFNEYVQNARTGFTTNDLNNWAQRIQGLQVEQAQMTPIALGSIAAGSMVANQSSVQHAHNDAQLIAQQAATQAQQYLPPSNTNSYATQLANAITGAPVPGDNYNSAIHQTYSSQHQAQQQIANQMFAPNHNVSNSVNQTNPQITASDLAIIPVGNSQAIREGNQQPSYQQSSDVQIANQQGQALQNDIISNNAPVNSSNATYDAPIVTSNSPSVSADYAVSQNSPAMASQNDLYQSMVSQTNNSGYMQDFAASSPASQYSAPQYIDAQPVNTNYSENLSPFNSVSTYEHTPIYQNEHPAFAPNDTHLAQPALDEHLYPNANQQVANNINSGNIMTSGIIAASTGAALGYAYGNQQRNEAGQVQRINRESNFSQPPQARIASAQPVNTSGPKQSVSRPMANPNQVATSRPASYSQPNAFTRALNTRSQSQKVTNSYTASYVASSSSAPNVSKRMETPFAEMHLASLRNKSSSINKDKLQQDLNEFAEDMEWNI
jgi:hypothetical protein